MEAPVVLLLLVEDELLIAEALKVTLEDGGYAALLAHSGDEAMSILEEKSVEISGLITDIRLGDGPNGWDVARRSRELKPDLPVVYMSGDSGGGWASQGVPKSVMLQKPFAPVQLITAIASLQNKVDSSLPHAPPPTDNH